MSTLFVVLFALYSAICRGVEVADFVRYTDLNGEPYNVTYDERSFIINGKRSILLGGSVHYPRFSAAEWPSIVEKAVADGLNHLEIYVFWNLHEPAYDFSGRHVYNYADRANITQFLEDAKNGGIFINLRIGPYACAEWSFGGVPVWLLHDENIVFRSSNKNWQDHMQTFVEEISDVTRPYLAKNGGPIILAQIENEYHGNDDAYVEWCGELAASLEFDMPWVMCNGESANTTVNTCNGNDCYQTYIPSHSSKFPGQPLAWTENEGWFQSWGVQYEANTTERDNRSPQDMAMSVAVWFAGGAAHHNYYMWMGGNHVGHFAGSSIANYYADGVNYHADGLPHEPKKSHLMRLHNILAKYNRALMGVEAQYGKEKYLIPVGDNDTNSKTFAYVYDGDDDTNSATLTFLVNMDAGHTYTLPWNSRNYVVPGYSATLLDGDGTALYNTATVDSAGLPTQRVYTVCASNLTFVSFSEPIPLTSKTLRSDSAFVNESPLEQLRLTNDTYEYLIYSTNGTFPLDAGKGSTLRFVGQAANAYTVYLDSEYMAQAFNYEHTSETMDFTIEFSVDITTGEHVLTIVSSSLGVDNFDGIQAGFAASECDKKGLTGSVVFSLSDSTAIDITNNTWSHYIGLTGEVNRIYAEGESKVQWSASSDVSDKGMTWFKSTFATPNQVQNDNAESVLLIDIGENSKGVNRGHFYVNGRDMGHYNNVQIKGEMVQRYYYIPKDYLADKGELNTLVFMEEYPQTVLSNVQVVSSTVVVPDQYD